MQHEKLYSFIGALLIIVAWVSGLGSAFVNLDSNIIHGNGKNLLMTFELAVNIIGVYFCAKTVDWKNLKLTSTIPRSLMFISAGAFGIIISGIGIILQFMK